MNGHCLGKLNIIFSGFTVVRVGHIGHTRKGYGDNILTLLSTIIQHPST